VAQGALSLAVLTALLVACRVEQRLPRPSTALRIPPDSEIPIGPMGASIRRGLALLRHTPDSLPSNAPSGLRCFSCHLRDGAQAGAFPLVGVYSRFPQYRTRNAMINLIEDRVNDCFERSLNGTALPAGGRDMRDIVAYLAFISRGISPPGEVAGMGFRDYGHLTPDTTQGRSLFQETCTRCHGGQGEGTSLAPPLWGPRSFNIGAGLARLYSAASFIKDNMPNDRVVTLNDQQAVNVAAYMLAQPRPDFARKAEDWPNGDPPPDVAYPTRVARTGKPAPPPP